MQFKDTYHLNFIKNNPMNFQEIDFDILSIPREIAELKWLCHSDVPRYIDLRKTIVTSGIGLSDSPHYGTISQIFRIIFLDFLGINTQIVLGDLDSYSTRNQNYDVVIERSKIYYEFIRKLGYKGILRTQREDKDVLLTAYLCSNYVIDQDFFDAEEDLSDSYKENKIYSGITYSVKQAILLMVADFLSLGINNKYKHVVVMLGLDEHVYVLLAKKVLEQMKLDFSISGLYSPLMKGLNGHKKFSKSIKGSGITVDMSDEEVENIILHMNDEYTSANESCLYQLCHSVGLYDTKTLFSIRNAFTMKDDYSIDEIKKDYIQRIKHINQLWRDCCKNSQYKLSANF